MRDLFPGLSNEYTEFKCSVLGDSSAFESGLLFFNGPGGFGGFGSDPTKRFWKHWLDGDGYVQRIDLARQKFTGRFVSTNKRLREASLGRPVYRGFATRFMGDEVSIASGIESPANVNVTPLPSLTCDPVEAILAWGESGTPYLLDAVSLDTKGTWERCREVAPFALFSGHPRRCLKTEAIYNFCLIYRDERTSLEIYRFEHDAVPQIVGHVDLPQRFSIHDFQMTPHFFVLALSPLTLDRDKVMRSGRTILESMSWNSETPTKVLVVPRRAPSEFRLIDLPWRYVIHWVAAEEVSDQLRLTVIEYASPLYPHLFTSSPYRNTPQGHLRQTLLCPLTGTIIHDTTCTEMRDPDFPVVTDHGVVALGLGEAREDGSRFFDRISQVATHHGSGALIAKIPLVTSWRCPSDTFLVGDVLQVPGQPYLYTQFIELTPSGRQRGIYAFAAARLDSGPCGQIMLPADLPFGLHGFGV